MTERSRDGTHQWDPTRTHPTYPDHPPVDQYVERTGLTFGPRVDRAARLEQLATRRDRTSRRRRPHPSRRSRVAALGLSLATTGGLTYAFASSASSAGSDSALTEAIVVAAAPTTTAPTTTAPATTSPTTTSWANRATAPTTTRGSATQAAPSTTAPASANGTASAAGSTTVNGAAYSNRYGAVQVQAVFGADGKLTAVNLLQLPTDRKSVAINNRAVPTLNSEALAIQSARVHTVSGATYTSEDYVKSLQSAIDAARANGVTKLT